MATGIGTLAVKITGSTTGLSAALEDAKKKLTGFEKSNNGKKGRGLNAFQAPQKSGQAAGMGFGESTSKALALAFAPAGAILGGLTLGLGASLGLGEMTALVGESIKLAAETEDAATSFKVLFNSADKSREVMKDLRGLAESTPLTSKELIASGTMLAGSGVSSDQITPTLSMLGDLTAVSGTPLKEMAILYNQVRSKGRLLATETLQFAEKQISINELLATSLGKSTGEIIGMTEAGQISFPMVQQALLQATSAGGRFFGMMDERSKTFNGVMSTMVDNWQQLLGAFGQEIIEQFDLKSLMGEATNYIKNARDHIGDMRPLMAAVRDIGLEFIQGFLGGVIKVLAVANEIAETMRRAKGITDLWLKPTEWTMDILGMAKEPRKKNETPEQATKRFIDEIVFRIGDAGKGFFNQTPKYSAITPVMSVIEELARLQLAFKTAQIAFGLATGGALKPRGLQIENERLTDGQIKKARDLIEQLDPLLKFNREVTELGNIRDRGGFTTPGTAGIFRGLDRAGVTDNQAFNLGMAEAFKPIMEKMGEKSLAVTAERGSVEAQSIINRARSDQGNVQEKALAALEAIKEIQKSIVDYNREIAAAVKAAQLVKVK